ncbi:glutamate racemase [Hominifimenecus sp. rT4P-3]|uniref:glutamate racemase n=1 Tax=Hominifimenecus sp. rT4P-3 TaxID=3242979 RepID=UPI003DA48A0B
MGNHAPIGVFDSGIGGLTVAREIMRQIPEERLVYFGDTARVPYGSKSQNTIIHFVRQIVRFLETKEVKAIVVACNTASAYALETIEKEIDVPVIGVVKPGAKTAAKASKNGRIGVIATDATINSGLYTKFIQSINPNLQVFGKACPLFVPLVEEGLTHDFVTEEIAKRYLKELKEKEIDTLILGCTHYPLLRSLIGGVMGDAVQLVNPAYETALGLRRLLTEKRLLSEDAACAEGKYEFFVSDGAEKFRVFANSILPYEIQTTQIVDIEKY